MSVFLLVLKIIGITLLSIIGLILLLLMLILFVPVRYRINADVHDGISGSARASWLLHILSFALVYDGSELSNGLRIFGIPFRKKEKRPKKEKRRKVSADTDETDHKAVSDRDDDRPLDRLPREDEYRMEGFDEPVKTAESVPEKEGSGKLQKIIDKIKSIYEKITGFLTTARNRTDLLCDEKNQATIKRALSLVIRLLSAIRPRKLTGMFHFGFEEPDTTGKILAIAAILYAWIGPSLVLKPDFEEVVLEGDADMKGRIFLITVAVIGARLYFDKELRRLYGKLKEA